MAFTQGIVQTVHITTLDGADPVAPSNPAVTVSLDGGATFEATDNPAVATLYGVSLELSAAETARDMVLVRVTADNADAQVVPYYFEDAYTAQRASNLDNADAKVSDVPTNAELAVALGSVQTHGDGAWATADVSGVPAAVDAALVDDFAAVLAAIAAAGAGAGANVVTLSIVDGDGDPVGSCPVRVENSGGQLVGFGFSNASTGIVVFNLDDGTYTVTLGPIANYAPTNPYSVVVSGATADDLEVVEIALPSPAIPGLCIIYEDLRYLDGTLLGASEGGLYVTARHSPQWAGDDADEGFMTRGGTSEEGPTDGSGRATLSLVRGIEVTIEVRTPERNKQYRVTVPDEDTARLSTLVEKSKW